MGASPQKDDAPNDARYRKLGASDGQYYFMLKAANNGDAGDERDVPDEGRQGR
jgi:hypothetical protein